MRPRPRPALAFAVALLAGALVLAAAALTALALIAPSAADARPTRRRLSFAVTLEVRREFATTLEPTSPMTACGENGQHPVRGTTTQRDTLRPARRAVVLSYLYTTGHTGPPIVWGPTFLKGANHDDELFTVADIARTGSAEQVVCDSRFDVDRGGWVDTATVQPVDFGSCVGTASTRVEVGGIGLDPALRGGHWLYLPYVPFGGQECDQDRFFPTRRLAARVDLGFERLRRAKRTLTLPLRATGDCTLREQAYVARCAATVTGRMTLTRLKSR